MDLEDSVEIGDLVSKINSNPQHLDAVFNEADKHAWSQRCLGSYMGGGYITCTIPARPIYK